MKIFLTIIFLVVCVALTAIVLMQEGKSAGLGSIGGLGDTYWGKNKSRSMEGTLVRVTKILAAVFLLLAVGLNMMPDNNTVTIDSSDLEWESETEAAPLAAETEAALAAAETEQEVLAGETELEAAASSETELEAAASSETEPEEAAVAETEKDAAGETEKDGALAETEADAETEKE